MRNLFKISIPLLIFSLFSLSLTSNAQKTNNNSDKIVVGVFNGNGASPVCVLETMEALKIDRGITPLEVTAYDIMNGKLDEIDVLIFPGGSGSKEYNNLGELAAEKVKEFARKKNKGLVGICAGGYLFSTTPGYPSLEIMPAPDIRDHYNRGRALIGFSVNKTGKEIFPELSNTDTAYYQYYDGPIYEIPENSKINVLATITTDITPKADDPKGVTPGKPAFFTVNYGEGRAIVSVGHPEATPGMRWIVPRMARWAAARKFVSYSKDVVRPSIYDHNVLYYPSIINNEKKWFWQLFSKDADTVVSALHNLHSIYSRPSIRWAKGLLRNNSSKVRLAAAEYLVQTEYTDALPDLKTAYETETDNSTKKELGKLFQKLNSIVKTHREN
jgi:glutamine amidotransferase-like uncharacterized protein